MSTCRRTASSRRRCATDSDWAHRSEEHTSELQSQSNLVCRLLLEKKKTITNDTTDIANRPSPTSGYGLPIVGLQDSRGPAARPPLHHSGKHCTVLDSWRSRTRGLA